MDSIGHSIGHLCVPGGRAATQISKVLLAQQLVDAQLLLRRCNPLLLLPGLLTQGRGIFSSPPKLLEVPPPPHPILGVFFLLCLASQDPLGSHQTLWAGPFPSV